MKPFMMSVLLCILAATVCGCASDTVRARIAPPEEMEPALRHYEKLPGNKVFVVAVDPTGQWAFGCDGDRATVEEAARNAAVKCDAARLEKKVFNKAVLYDVNGRTVYYNQYPAR